MATIESPTLNPGRLATSVEEIKARRGAAPWAERIVVNERFTITVICQEPGHVNDWHYHVVDEAWYIYEGELSWTTEGQPDPIKVSAGDWIIAPPNTFHFIQVHGERPAIRIAISHTGEPHRHEREDKPPAPPGARLS
jgi:quercetin dioxygenase-like cupin family protein